MFALLQQLWQCNERWHGTAQQLAQRATPHQILGSYRVPAHQLEGRLQDIPAVQDSLAICLNVL